MLILDDVVNNRTEWLRLRAEGLTASELPVVAGLSPYMSAFELYCQKKSLAEPTEESDAMWLGTQMEPILGSLFARKTKMKVTPCQKLFRHDEVPWLMATPDFEIEDPETYGLGKGKGMLQTKNTSYRNIKQWQDAVPFAAQLQNQIEMACTSSKWGAVAGLVGADAREFHFKLFDYSPDVFSQVVEIGEKFMHCLKTNTPPTPGGNDRSLINKIIGERAESTCELPAEAYPIVQEYMRFKELSSALNAQVKEQSAELKARENQLLLMMGKATVGHVGEFVVKVKNVSVSEKMVKGYSFLKFDVKEAKA